MSKTTRYPYKPMCFKKAHLTQEEAEEHIQALRQSGKTKDGVVPYQCDICNQWHVKHQ